MAATEPILVNGRITPLAFSDPALCNVEFFVPLYQRLFVWEESQIQRFLEDLWQASKRPSEPYYIGILTIYQRPREQYKWELVDGQQRITALTLLLASCLRLSDAAWADPLTRGRQCIGWADFLTRDGGQASRLTYFARDADKKDLEAIRERGVKADVTNPQMKLFLNLFDRFVTERKLSGADDITTFGKFVYKNVTALLAKLPDTYNIYDLNLHYEKGNAAGKQLESHEILKVRYFGNHAERWNAVADGSKKFDRGTFERGGPDGAANSNSEGPDGPTLLEVLGGKGVDEKEKNEPPSHIKAEPDPVRLVMSFPMFLLHVLWICIGNKAPEVEKKMPGFWMTNNLLSTFDEVKKCWDEANGGPFADAFLKAMDDYRLWMDKWIIHIENNGGDDRPVSPYPQDDVECEVAFRNQLWQFQSTLYVSSDNFQQWVLEAYQNCSDRKPNINIDNFLKLLQQQDNRRHPLPSSVDEVCANLSYGSINRYWFWKLDYILWEKREELFKNKDHLKAVEKYVFRQNRSIEHLHPQNPPESVPRWEEPILHSFGNLAMISASFNSQQSNSGTDIKFARLREQLKKNELESLKLLCMFNVAQEKNVDWTPDASKAHCKTMLDILGNWYNGVEQTKPVFSELSGPADGDHGDQVPRESAHISTREKPEPPPTSG